jgi:hypothetical protein
MEDTEVSSQRTSLGRGRANETVEKVPEVNTSVAEDLGEAIPMTTDGGDPQQSGPQPDTIPETNAAPGLDKQPSLKEGGGASAASVTSTNSEAPNALEEALQRASIVVEHHTLMGAVVEKVQSAKSGPNKAFTSLLTGFEVCDVMF